MLEVINNANLVVKREDRIYKFEVDNNANLGEIHDVLHEMIDFVVQKINEVNKPKETVEEAVKEG